jgi:hypothetical protein
MATAPDYFPAILSLIGVLSGALIGGGLSFWGTWVAPKRALDLKIWEKLLDCRITAHENVVRLALQMRNMEALGKPDSQDELPRAPQVMMSKEAFFNWLNTFAQESGPASTWLATPVKREVNFVQDYFVMLHTYLSEISSDDDFATVGNLIRQDFIDLSANLEKVAFKFFEVEARKLHLNDLSEWHKFPLEETRSRLGKTVLLQNLAKIRAFCKMPG